MDITALVFGNLLQQNALFQIFYLMKGSETTSMLIDVYN